MPRRWIAGKARWRVKPQTKGSLKMFLNAVLASLKLASLVFRLPYACAQTQLVGWATSCPPLFITFKQSTKITHLSIQRFQAAFQHFLSLPAQAFRRLPRAGACPCTPCSINPL
ncbi:hypothetical protein GCWU000324_01604 [Kingella oralis ATCC 51147]|uniref:Uncharacterized protein n=1 Tax=Kingella oralis ATCC 51147 TaxID=629741 RepID=C4GKU8_9NEIS|nr:hypothetical protein GCWU000324_01604 [Kingella oralis ATCC 51147]